MFTEHQLRCKQEQIARVRPTKASLLCNIESGKLELNNQSKTCLITIDN